MRHPVNMPMKNPHPTDPLRAHWDARCFKCGRTVGWSGTLMDRPPCPACGANLSRADLVAANDIIRVILGESEDAGTAKKTS